MSNGQLETVDFLLSRAARLDKALKSLPKSDLKALHTSSHKRARRLLRNLSFPSKARELTDENIQNRIDVLTSVKTSAASFAKKMPPLTDALTVGPDAMAVRACALEAREGLAEDLCSAEVARTAASLDWVATDALLDSPTWPSVEAFGAHYVVPEACRPPARPRPPAPPLRPLPCRPTIKGMEAAEALGRYPDLLPALLKSASGEIEPAVRVRSPSKNVFYATSCYREACRRFHVTPLEKMPIFGEIVEVLGANLDETRHCYALAEGVRACSPLGLIVEGGSMPDQGAAALLHAAFAGERLEKISLQGMALSHRSILELYHALGQRRLGGALRELRLAACGLGCDLEEIELDDAYLQSREIVDKELEEHELVQKGDVNGVLSEHLQESLMRAKAAERPALPPPEEREDEEAPWPVLLPVFAQLISSKVTSLNLSQTWLSASSLSALTRSLPSTQIESLYLEECGLDDEALEELALRGILRSRLLLELSLRRNRFSGNPGAITTLFHAVRIHARLAFLDFAENLMHPECLPELSELLKRSLSLLSFHLLGCENSQVEDNVAVQAFCYRWVTPEELEAPEPAQGEEHSELILCRAPHLDVKTWQVASPPPQNEVESKRVFNGCWITEERKKNPKFVIPEGVPEATDPEEQIGDWELGPSRVAALRACFEEDIKVIYLKDVCHVDDEEAVKEAFRSKYDLYYECYALFAGRSLWPYVRYVDMYNVFDEGKVVDRTVARKRRTLQMQDIHVMVTQTLANHAADEPSGPFEAGKKKQQDSDAATRPLFCEVMLRAAIGWAEDLHPSAAITSFADEIVAGRLLQPPLSPFPRGVALRNGEYSEALQNSSEVLQEAWERFGYSNVAFQRLAQLVRLYERSFTSKHVASIYALAKQPVPDYHVTGVARGLTYQEFSEAVGRLALVWSRSGQMPACCPKEDGTLRGRQWPSQPVAFKPVKERLLAKRLERFLDRLAERMKPSARSRGFL